MELPLTLTNDIAIVLVIGLTVAFLIEVAKHTRINGHLSTLLVDLITLMLGLAGGLFAMYVNGGTFSQYVAIGLTGGMTAPYIYNVIKKITGGKYTKTVGEV